MPNDRVGRAARTREVTPTSQSTPRREQPTRDHGARYEHRECVGHFPTGITGITRSVATGRRVMRPRRDGPDRSSLRVQAGRQLRRTYAHGLRRLARRPGRVGGPARSGVIGPRLPSRPCTSSSTPSRTRSARSGAGVQSRRSGSSSSRSFSAAPTRDPSRIASSVAAAIPSRICDETKRACLRA